MVEDTIDIKCDDKLFEELNIFLSLAKLPRRVIYATVINVIISQLMQVLSLDESKMLVINLMNQFEEIPVEDTTNAQDNN